ncbi:MAG: site-specific integrase [Myxococcales bacterium]|jgi:integrase|nr:site-specific integrase [Myxococcales bacterium]
MGTVHLNQDGRWEITYQLASGAEWTTTTPATSRNEAERLVHHCELQTFAIRATGVALTPAAETFAALWNWWFERFAGRYSATWQRTMRQLARSYLLPSIGILYAGEIKPADFQRSMQAWVNHGMKRRTANAVRSIAIVIVRDAIADGRWPLISNPFQLARPFGIPRKNWPTLALDEARTLINASLGDRQALWALAVGLGLRRGELFALRREDFSTSKRAVNVRRSHDRDETKSGAERLLPLTDHLWSIVQPHLELLKSPSALLFPGRHGKFLHRDYKLPKRLRADLVRLKIQAPPDFRAHDLRHTFATLAEEAGGAQNVIRATLGHAGGVTERYQHTALEKHRSELSKLDFSPREEAA